MQLLQEWYAPKSYIGELRALARTLRAGSHPETMKYGVTAGARSLSKARRVSPEIRKRQPHKNDEGGKSCQDNDGRGTRQFIGAMESCRNVNSSSNVNSEGFLHKMHNGESHQPIERDHSQKIECRAPRQSIERTRRVGKVLP